MQRTRLCTAATLALVALAAATAPVSGAASNVPPNRFQVSPTLQIATGRPPAPIPDTLVTNTTTVPYKVKVKAVRLRQQLAGLFVYSSRRLDSRWAQLVLGTVGSFTLRPGQARSVPARWLGMPPRVRAAPVGIAVLGTPVLPTGKTGIGTRVQVVRLDFLSLPGGPPPRGKLPLVRAQQVGLRKLQIATRVRNTGKQFAAPRRGLLVIRRQGGPVVQRSHWNGGGRLGFVIPGAQREYAVKVTKLLPAGVYIVDSWAHYGRKRLHVRGRFKLVGPNELPTAAVTLVSLDVHPNPGSPEFELTLRNVGNVPVSPSADVTLSPVLGGRRGTPTARQTFNGTAIRPGATGTIKGKLGHVNRGIWELRARARIGAQFLPTASNRFKIQPRRGLFSRFRRWLGDHTVLAIVIAAVILLGVLVFLLVATRRRYRRELEEARAVALPPPPPPPAPAPAPAPAPVPVPVRPAADGVVDLNSAGVEQLMMLPGVGRRAAERIVEHRTQNGPFASLDDLAAVEGFHSERVHRLAPHAHV